MRDLSMTVKEFVDHYIAKDTKKIRIIKSFSVHFEGNLENLYNIPDFRKDELLNANVCIISASDDGYLCLSCK